MVRRKRFTLMPAIAIAALGLVVGLPSLSGTRLYAATPQRYAVVQVRPGDTLWGIAAKHAAAGTDISQLVDEISDANHLEAGSLQPGERLRIPE